MWVGRLRICRSGVRSIFPPCSQSFTRSLTLAFRQTLHQPASGSYVALKYLADGWWKTSAETEASGSIMWPSVRWRPIWSG
jgi:hypothetical protein